MTDYDSLEDALDEFGSLEEISDEILEELGYTRRLDGSVTKKKGDEKQIESAHKLLNSFKGYLCAHDYSLLHQAARREIELTDRDFAEIGGRAKKFREAGLKIFDDELFTPTSFRTKSGETGEELLFGYFPSISFVVGYVSETYFEKVQWWKQKGFDKAPIPRVRPEELETVRKRLFLDGEIDKALLRELKHYVENQFRTQPENEGSVLDSVEQAVRFLGDKLEPAEDESKDSWTGSLPDVGERFWYSDFSRSTREEIVKAYLRQVDLTRLHRVKKERKRLNKLAYIFPGITGGPEKAEQTIERVKVERACMSAVRAFDEDLWQIEDHQDRILYNLERWFEVAELKDVLRGIDPMTKMFGINKREILDEDPYNTLIREMQLRRVRQASGEEIREALVAIGDSDLIRQWYLPEEVSNVIKVKI
ncbi:MAG: hypothetical protein ABEJ02_04445 [Candidatus Paceibacteria bacterium]